MVGKVGVEGDAVALVRARSAVRRTRAQPRLPRPARSRDCRARASADRRCARGAAWRERVARELRALARLRRRSAPRSGAALGVAASPALIGTHDRDRAALVEAQQLREAQLQAGAMRAATVSVGLVSPRSTCESIGALTPLRSARSRSDSEEASRSAFTRAPMTFESNASQRWSRASARFAVAPAASRSDIRTYAATDAAQPAVGGIPAGRHLSRSLSLVSETALCRAAASDRFQPSPDIWQTPWTHGFSNMRYSACDAIPGVCARRRPPSGMRPRVRRECRSSRAAALEEPRRSRRRGCRIFLALASWYRSVYGDSMWMRCAAACRRTSTFSTSGSTDMNEQSRSACAGRLPATDDRLHPFRARDQMPCSPLVMTRFPDRCLMRPQEQLVYQRRDRPLRYQSCRISTQHRRILFRWLDDVGHD